MTDVAQLRTLEAASDDAKPLGDWSSKPAVPATGVAVTNTSGYTMIVEVAIGPSSGTITNVKVDGVIVGGGVPRTSGAFRVRAGSTIAITWGTTSPTWQWFYA